eukprot:TRINITY_DN6924_c1_g1_i4.p1 TRINITY_DN6924_c1_g1~~TRINITY_DN6924_c1_g1_i4.p1  ORF type:complete len:677 (+),score=25.87 TRINITY_DN6924_c1_g1_i4:305-2335(+)
MTVCITNKGVVDAGMAEQLRLGLFGKASTDPTQCKLSLCAAMLAEESRNKLFYLLLTIYHSNAGPPTDKCVCTGFDACNEVVGLCELLGSTEDANYADGMKAFVGRHKHLARRWCGVANYTLLYTLAVWIVYPERRVLDNSKGAYNVLGSRSTVFLFLKSLAIKAARVPLPHDNSASVDQETVEGFCVYVWGMSREVASKLKSKCGDEGNDGDNPSSEDILPAIHDLRKEFITRLFAVSGGGVPAVFRLLLDIHRRAEVPRAKKKPRHPCAVLHPTDCSYECVDSWGDDIDELPLLFAEQHAHLVLSKRIVSADFGLLFFLAKMLSIKLERNESSGWKTVFGDLRKSLQLNPKCVRLYNILQVACKWKPPATPPVEEMQRRIVALNEDVSIANVRPIIEYLRSGLWDSQSNNSKKPQHEVPSIASLALDRSLSTEDAVAKASLQAQMLYAAAMVKSPQRNDIFKLLLNMHRYNDGPPTDQCVCTGFDACNEVEKLCTLLGSTEDANLAEAMKAFVGRHQHLARRRCTAANYTLLYTLAVWIVMYPDRRLKDDSKGAYTVLGTTLMSGTTALKTSNSLAIKAARVPLSPHDNSASVVQETVVENFCVYVWGMSREVASKLKSKCGDEGNDEDNPIYDLRKDFITRLFAVRGGGVPAVFRLLLDIHRRAEAPSQQTNE